MNQTKNVKCETIKILEDNKRKIQVTLGLAMTFRHNIESITHQWNNWQVGIH